MSPPKILVTRSIQEDGLRLLKDNCSVDVWDSQEVMPKHELMNRIKGCEGILCVISDEIDKDILDAAGPQLKVVSTMSVGTHHINTRECKKRGVAVCSTPDVCSDSAAEMTVLLLLLAARRCVEGHQAVINGEWGLWKPMWICGTEMAQRTLGILGFGRVGFGVARRLKPFGIKRIIYNDVSYSTMGDDVGAEYVDKETLYRESDFLVVSCGLNGMTHKMINKSVFDKMKPSAIFINSSRGQIVETDDLVEALRSKKILAAGLDVTDPEPLPVDHPLLKMDNCIVTPHLGTNTVQARKAMSINAAENILGSLK